MIAQYEENQICLDATGGYTTISAIEAFLFTRIAWSPCSRKMIVMSPSLLATLFERIGPAVASLGLIDQIRLVAGKRVPVSPLDVPAVLRTPDVLWPLPDSNLILFGKTGCSFWGVAKADAGCPDGEIWIVDQEYFPWADGVMMNLV